MKLSTPRLVLRELRKSDAANIAKNVSDREVAKNLLVVPHPYSLNDAYEFLARCANYQQTRPRVIYNFALELKSERQLVGLIGLKDVNRFNGTGSLGYWLARLHHRQGLMSEAVAAMIEFAFAELKLRRIEVCAFAENRASNGLIKKLGFTYEGKGRQSLRDRATGAIHDENRYGLLKGAWRKLRPRC